MSREITLEELGASARKSAQQLQRQAVKQQQAQQKPATPPGGGKMVGVDRNTITSALAEAHPEEVAAREKEKETITPELITDAFGDMQKAIERKKQAAREMVEAVAEEAEERQFEAESEINEEAIEAEVNSLDSFENDIDNELSEDEEIEESIDETIEEAKKQRPVVAAEVVVNVPDQNEIQAQEDVVEEAPKPAPKKKAPKKEIEDEEEDLDDIDGLLSAIEEESKNDDDDDDIDDETPEEIRERFKKSMTSIVSTTSPIDFKEFTIRKKPISAARLLNNIDNTTLRRKKVDWPLYHTGKNVTFVECDGPELEALRKSLANRNNLNNVITTLKFMYNHIEDPNKPTFENWTKSIRTEDIESIYFGEYLACYCDSNIMIREHTKTKNGTECGKTSMIETDVYKMVKYADDEAKEKMAELRNKDTTTPANSLKATFMQISDDYGITYRPATLYSTFVQYASLKPEITQKYSDILNTMAYVEDIFYIDRQSKELVPIEIKQYPNNLNKTVLTKLKTYAKILKTLSTDQYEILNGKLSDIIEDPKISYVYPEVTCPECGETIPEEEIDSMLSVLFTRAQLAQIKSL